MQDCQTFGFLSGTGFPLGVAMANSGHMSLSDMRRGAMVTLGFSFTTILVFSLSVLPPQLVAPT